MNVKKRLIALFMVLAMVFALQTCVLAQEMSRKAQTRPRYRDILRRRPRNRTNTAASAPVTSRAPGRWKSELVGYIRTCGLGMFSEYSSSAKTNELYGIACNLYEKIANKTITPAANAPFTAADGPRSKEAWTIGILADEKSYEPEKPLTGEVISVLFDTLESANVGLDLTRTQAHRLSRQNILYPRG